MAQKSTVYGLYSYDPGPRPQLRVTPRCQRSAAAFALLHPPASAPPEPLYRPDSVQPTEHSTTAEPPSPPFGATDCRRTQVLLRHSQERPSHSILYLPAGRRAIP